MEARLRNMRIACLGGGPGGLYFAISMKLRHPDTEVTVYERNRADDTFGWGVVFSDQTLANLRANDDVSADLIEQNFAYWDDLAVVIKGTRETSRGHGFCGIGRKQLLILLQNRAQQLGVNISFSTEIADVAELRSKYDLVVACDGLNSLVRNTFAGHFRPMIDRRACKFVWLGTHQKFDDAFTFIFEETSKGYLWAHAYQFNEDTATFIVETDEATWTRYGFADMSQEESIRVCEDIFKDHLGGHALMTNASHIRGSAWINFPRVICENWHHENIVLLGDAAATAHFSIGSGTKLAMESAIALADEIAMAQDVGLALANYEASRKQEVLRIQSAALNSLEWFENIHRYLHFHPVQFYYSQLTRSQRISHENLRQRDPDWLAKAESWFSGSDAMKVQPVDVKLQLGNLVLPNRLVCDAPFGARPPSEDVAVDQYTRLAKEGAGLIVTEPIAVHASGQFGVNASALFSAQHGDHWANLLARLKTGCDVAVCARLGHAGACASEMAAPMSASPVRWGDNYPIPQAATSTDLNVITEAFTVAARRAIDAGFNMIEIDASAGGLLASFLSPITNKRADTYGGSLAKRAALPVQVVEQVRKSIPDGVPISVRFAAHDWLEGGICEKDAVFFARAFVKHGADILAVTTGGILETAVPRFGRMYQTPHSDHIRNEARVPTIAVGNITNKDQANSILLAGRADLVVLETDLQAVLRSIQDVEHLDLEAS